MARSATVAPVNSGCRPATLEGQTVCLTGVTGFLGRALIEKLLRARPGIRRIFVLMRASEPGGAQAARRRWERELLDSVLFRRLREEKSQFERWVRGKVEPIAADLSREDLGLTPEAVHLLRQEVDIFVNAAATVRFDERWDRAVQNNVLGPERLVWLARTGKRQASLIHVSTAFVNRCGVDPGSESLLRANTLDIDEEIEAGLRASCLSDCEARQIGLERARRHQWPNAYTFSKMLGEQLLAREHGATPVAIVRPSIIEGALAEPFPGWLHGFRMADPIIVAVGHGWLRSFPGDARCILDVVPVDHVVNTIVAAMARTDPNLPLTIYQVASSDCNPLRLGDIGEYCVRHFRKQPLKARKLAKEVPAVTFVSERHFRRMLAVRLTALRLGVRLGLRPREELQRAEVRTERALQYAELYAPYVTNSQRFRADNTRDLLEWAKAQGMTDIVSDIAGLDWRHYFEELHIPGLRSLVLGEGVSGAA